MIALNVFDIKNTMAQLLIQSGFDEFFLEEVSVTTFANIKISGRRNPDWYDSDQEENLPRLLLWKEMKPLVFEYIKGKKTPAFFSLSLKLQKEMAEEFIEDKRILDLIWQDKIEFLLHFRFEKGKLTVVTGSSQKEFIIDKMPERTWDMSVKKYFKKLHITYED